ncbi:MAG: prepilin-type N-terminal cleavage/methylation domain-containing protein [candidate division Zixibacteria bacterium]|nr:prepilin-type N-terminal cleavage/methylation domain-containing protein [candidate division Zixibacteria bacterium]
MQLSLVRREYRGFTLVELVIMIVVIGILATIATREMSGTIEDAHWENTKKELDQLAFAIVGNPDIYVGGARSDFGYVGDVGGLPSDLNALVTNPGSYATWDGPYADSGTSGTEHLSDAWGTAYTYTDTLLRSTGSGSNIDKLLANSSSDLLSNTISGTIVDAGRDIPGSVYRDSLQVRLTYPNGSGGSTTAIVNPSSDGWFSISSIPVGNRTLQVIYIPNSDTATYAIGVLPGRTARLDIVFPADLW